MAVPNVFPEQVFPVCCPPFTNLWPGREFAATDTPHRRTCFVGIEEHGEADAGERWEGWWCGFGCNHCDDTQLNQQFDQMDGGRWLAPVEAPQGRDAHGLYHDLRSHEGAPVRPYMEYHRGTCWKNARGFASGIECFGGDVCSCVFDNSTTRKVVGTETRCSDGTPIGEPLQAFLPDEFFYTGYRFPPTTAPPNWIDANGLVCRRFQDARLPSGWNSVVSLGAERINSGMGDTEAMLMPVFASDAACVRDWLVECTQKVVRSPASVCHTSAGHQWGPLQQDYYEASQSVRTRFSHLILWANTAHIRNSTDAMGDRDDATIDFKNKVLEFVKTNEFRTPNIRFDRLSYAWEQMIGLYSRDWFRITPEPVEEVPNVFGACHLAKSGCPVEVRVYVDAVNMRTRLMLHKLMQHNLDDTSTPWAVPYAVFYIGAEMLYVATLPEPCIMHQSWRPEDDPLREQPITIGRDARFNTIAPEPEGIDWIVFKDPEGRTFHPTPFVEWRGRLGGWTRPTAFGQRERIPSNEGCTGVSARVDGVRIPGIPDAAESHPDDRAQIYGGEVTVGFGL